MIDPIIDTVRHHHDPGSALPADRRLAGAVHVAHAIVSNDPRAAIDESSIERAGCTADLATRLRLAQTG